MLIAEPLLTQRLQLRSLTASDASQAYLSWMTDPQVLRFLEARHGHIDIGALRDFIESCNAAEDVLLLGICEATGRHVGNIKLGPIEQRYACAPIGIVIGERDCWGRGYAAEVIRALTRHAFERMALAKLYAGCYSSNHGSERAFLGAGWLVEGRQRARWVLDGKREDNVLLGCWRDDWESLPP
jgi:[ribosomal protein S5]-alanine N-acetyltransferase